LKAVENSKLILTAEEKGDIANANDNFKAFKNTEGGAATTIVTNDNYISAVGRKINGKVCCKLSTTLRCNGEEALVFLLDVTSRSLWSERDAVDIEDGAKNVVKEEGHTRTVNIVEEMTGFGGTHFNNSIVRKLVWEKRHKLTERTTRTMLKARRTTRTAMRTSRKSAFGKANNEFVVSGTPAEIEPSSMTISKKPSASMKFKRRRSSAANATKVDNGVLAVKIAQVGEEESTVEVLVVDLPSKTKQKGKQFYVEEKTASVSVKEKKEAERLLPTMYDYRSLSTMHRSFQRYVGERAKRASRSNIRRGNYAAYSIGHAL